jgi:hypothetical protein
MGSPARHCVLCGPSVTSLQTNGKLHPLYERATVSGRLKFEFPYGQRPPAETLNLFHFSSLHAAGRIRSVDAFTHLGGKDELSRVGRTSIGKILARCALGRIFGQMPAFDVPWVGGRVKGRGQPCQVFIAPLLFDQDFPAGRHGLEDEHKLPAAERPREAFPLNDTPCEGFMKAWIAHFVFEFTKGPPLYLRLRSIDAAGDLAIFDSKPICSAMGKCPATPRLRPRAIERQPRRCGA